MKTRVLNVTFALVLLLDSCASYYFIEYWIRPNYPQEQTETLSLEGLEAPVRIYFDALGVPHIRAESEPDLLRAVGFMHGRNRFFQMDTIRRYAYGRLSELVGEQRLQLGSTVELDLSMRSWGFERSARLEAAALDHEGRRLMSAYTAGVNAALALHRPIEYRLLGVNPEPWEIPDSFAACYMISWGITHNWRQELIRLLLALEGGYARSERIYPSHPWPGEASIPGPASAASAPAGAVPQSEYQLPPALVPELEEMFPAPRKNTAEGPEFAAANRNASEAESQAEFLLAAPETASNGWVIGGARTSSGRPMVVGELHLPHSLPSLAFQQHLYCPAFDFIGFTIPGIPFSFVGHNRQVAWTLTSAMADVFDLYIEKPDPQQPGHVIGPAGSEPLTVEKVEILIREGRRMRVLEEELRYTARGPLINDMFPNLLPADAPLVSVHGLRLNARESIRAMRQACKAEIVSDLFTALRELSLPINVVSAADTSGNTAMFTTGSVPVRRFHRGTFPVPAWTGKYRWQRLAAEEELPGVFGTEEAAFIHTNNLTVDPAGSPVLFQIDSAPSYRRDRIRMLLDSRQNHSLRSSLRILGDVHLLQARRLLPQMLADLQGAADEHPEQTKRTAALRLLAEWDYEAAADSAACSIFSALYRESIYRAFSDEIGPVGLNYALSFRYFTNVVDLWYTEEAHPVWDIRSTTTKETRREIIRASFAAALEWLSQEYGADPNEWKWGKLHSLSMQHPLGSRIKVFNLESWPAPGAGASVWKSCYDLSDHLRPFADKYGPVLRVVMDLGDLDHGWWIIDSGSSGWPLSPHYADQFEYYRAVELAPMNSAWEELQTSAAQLLVLE